jgi:hypothetical protein
MTTAVVDTYSVRVEKYKRREQMTIWVAAGIATLVAFVGARALDGAPRIFTNLVFTGAAISGLAVAFARVNFEWQATLLNRKVKANPTIEGEGLASIDQPWPGFAEGCWIGALLLIFLSWGVMLVGLWWPRPQALAPVIVGKTELPAIDLGSVGPFPDCGTTLSTTNQGQIDLIAQNYHARLSTDAKATLILLVGAADNRRLSARCGTHFATNEQLAEHRATSVREKLESRLRGEPIQPSYVILSSGPRHLEDKREGEGRKLDRSVTVWVVVGQTQIGTKQQP